MPLARGTHYQVFLQPLPFLAAQVHRRLIYIKKVRRRLSALAPGGRSTGTMLPPRPPLEPRRIANPTEDAGATSEPPARCSERWRRRWTRRRARCCPPAPARHTRSEAARPPTHTNPPPLAATARARGGARPPSMRPNDLRAAACMQLAERVLGGEHAHGVEGRRLLREWSWSSVLTTGGKE